MCDVGGCYYVSYLSSLRFVSVLLVLLHKDFYRDRRFHSFLRLFGVMWCCYYAFSLSNILGSCF